MSAELPRAGGTTPGERTDPRTSDASGTTLSIAEASRRYGVSVATLRRKLHSGVLTGAYKQPGPKGEEWRLPVAALAALGYRTPPAPDVKPDDTSEPAEVDRLREQVQELEHRAELAEALASERERALEDLRVALRALGPGDPQAPAPHEPTGPPQAPRRRWPWARTR